MESEIEPLDDIQTDRFGLGDFLIAALVAALAVSAQFLWAYPGLHPSVWNDAAAGAGIRPAAHVLPGFFVLVARSLYAFLGVGAGNAALRLLGHFAFGAIAFAAYATLREVLSFAMRIRPQQSPRRTLVSRIAAAVGTVAFVTGDPLWAAGQCLSETSVLVLLTLLAVDAFFLFVRKGSLACAYVCAVALGLLSAETPAGFALVAAIVALNHVVMTMLPSLEVPLPQPAAVAVGKWYVTFLYIVSLLAGVAVNSFAFVSGDGLAASGVSAGALPLAYLGSYWRALVSAASPGGWILFFGVAVAPFIVAYLRVPAGADEEEFLSYASGLMFIVCGAIAFSQFVSVPVMWFWTHFEVRSDYLLSLGLFLSAATLASAVTILGVDALCRNHQRLADQLFGIDASDEEDDTMRIVAPSRPLPQPADGSDEDDEAAQAAKPSFLRRASVVVVPAVLVLAMVPGRVKESTRWMLSIVRDAVAETVRETEGAECLFTDGSLDAALELESVRRGGSLKCHSLAQSAGPYDAFLRRRGLSGDSEDALAFRYDAATGLRSWVVDRPKRLDSCAVQLGFNLWSRDGRPLPPVGGMLSRPSAKDEKGLERDIQAAHVLAERTLDVYDYGIFRCTEKPVRDAFQSVQWRLARLAEVRSGIADRRGDTKAAAAEAALARKLDAANPRCRELRRRHDETTEQLLQRLSPREGLQLALVRGDFVMAKAYAESIVEADPENGDANFALGMFYATERQFARAEEFLTRCLVMRPKEPAVYNNLAMVQLERGKLSVAEINAKKALALSPHSLEVRDTISRIAKECDKSRDKVSHK